MTEPLHFLPPSYTEDLLRGVNDWNISYVPNDEGREIIDRLCDLYVGKVETVQETLKKQGLFDSKTIDPPKVLRKCWRELLTREMIGYFSRFRKIAEFGYPKLEVTPPLFDEWYQEKISWIDGIHSSDKS